MRLSLILGSLLMPLVAWADVAPGGGCRCATAMEPSLAWLPMALGALVLLAGRRRR
jgi:MYXO-CTERM domain-containing protein